MHVFMKQKLFQVVQYKTEAQCYCRESLNGNFIKFYIWIYKRSDNRGSALLFLYFHRLHLAVVKELQNHLKREDPS